MYIRHLKTLFLSTMISALISTYSQAEEQAEEFCFSLAENYYEQLYCELKARGVSKGLPSFYAFKKNEPLIQSLLLKRPAARIGIEVSLPKKISRPKPKPVPVEPLKPDTIRPLKYSSHPLAHCALSHGLIECESEQFHLTGNKRNKNLLDGVLLSDNKLALEPYQPEVHKNKLLDKYLENAYGLYIDKMLEIGLGAKTLSYPKFTFLFDDMEANNVDFSGRFETMFVFLKKDKLSISVSEKVPDDASVIIENCMSVNTQVVACQSGRKNYLYVKKRKKNLSAK